MIDNKHADEILDALVYYTEKCSSVLDKVKYKKIESYKENICILADYSFVIGNTDAHYLNSYINAFGLTGKPNIYKIISGDFLLRTYESVEALADYSRSILSPYFIQRLKKEVFNP